MCAQPSAHNADTDAVTKRLSATDPEPPFGSIVVDDIGRRWVRFDEDGRCWAQIEADGSPVDDDTESWTKVAGNYGPVQLIDGSGVGCESGRESVDPSAPELIDGLERENPHS